MSTTCRGRIIAGGPTILTFASFATEASYDILRVFEGTLGCVLAPTSDAHRVFPETVALCCASCSTYRVLFHFDRSTAITPLGVFECQFSATVSLRMQAISRLANSSLSAVEQMR
jgi:hypothetical protein